MIDIRIATTIRDAWYAATHAYLGGKLEVDADELRKELHYQGISYYTLREYLNYYFPASFENEINDTLEILYFPQASALRNNNRITLNLITMSEIKNNVIKIINKSDNPLPKYETEGASGMDLRAYISAEETDGERQFNLMPLERRLVHTGLYVELPKGTELQIRSRSGLARDYGVVVLNAPGTVDSDYRGEICVNLINLSQNVFTVRSGERIAQAVLASYIQAEFEMVKILSETKRADGAHGSTGLS